ncbi:hypothetical protein PFISCL1PPCAC_29073, partial [Pristionchus fissidentatus]
VEDIMAELLGETNERPVAPPSVGSDTPRLDSMSADQFLDRILGSDWKNHPPYETPQQFKDKKKKFHHNEGRVAYQCGCCTTRWKFKTIIFHLYMNHQEDDEDDE